MVKNLKYFRSLALTVWELRCFEDFEEKYDFWKKFTAKFVWEPILTSHYYSASWTLVLCPSIIFQIRIL